MQQCQLPPWAYQSNGFAWSCCLCPVMLTSSALKNQPPRCWYSEGPASMGSAESLAIGYSDIAQAGTEISHDYFAVAPLEAAMAQLPSTAQAADHGLTPGHIDVLGTGALGQVRVPEV